MSGLLRSLRLFVFSSQFAKLQLLKSGCFRGCTSRRVIPAVSLRAGQPAGASPAGIRSGGQSCRRNRRSPRLGRAKQESSDTDCRARPTRGRLQPRHGSPGARLGGWALSPAADAGLPARGASPSSGKGQPPAAQAGWTRPAAAEQQRPQRAGGPDGALGAGETARPPVSPPPPAAPAPHSGS